MGRLDRIREDLDLLRRRMVSGEIDSEKYRELRELLLGELKYEEYQELELTPPPNLRGRLGPSGVVTHVPGMADLDLEKGEVLLEQFRIIRELGRGGFGAVFEAEDVHLGRNLAVKVLDPKMAARSELLARFRREVGVMRDLSHRRVVRVFDYREDSNQHLAMISMELIGGGSVRDLQVVARERGEEIPVGLTFRILSEVFEALAAAHAKGIIHRDVTPGNILLGGSSAEELLEDPEKDPGAKLVDFGIAGLADRTELSQKSRVLGTAAYVAPEVLNPDREITVAADCYGAGAVGYHLLTGELPLGRFPAPSELREGLPEGADELLLGLLHLVPGRRPAPGDAAVRAGELVERARVAAGEAGRRSLLERQAAKEQTEEERKRREKITRIRRALARAVAKGDEPRVAKSLKVLEALLGVEGIGDGDLEKAGWWLEEWKNGHVPAAKIEREFVQATTEGATPKEATLKDVALGESIRSFNETLGGALEARNKDAVREMVSQEVTLRGWITLNRSPTFRERYTDVLAEFEELTGRTTLWLEEQRKARNAAGEGTAEKREKKNENAGSQRKRKKKKKGSEGHIVSDQDSTKIASVRRQLTVALKTKEPARVERAMVIFSQAGGSLSDPRWRKAVEFLRDNPNKELVSARAQLTRALNSGQPGKIANAMEKFKRVGGTPDDPRWHDAARFLEQEEKVRKRIEVRVNHAKKKRKELTRPLEDDTRKKPLPEKKIEVGVKVPMDRSGTKPEERNRSWESILWIALGWGISAAIGAVIGPAFGVAIGPAFGAAIGGAIGGSIVMWQINKSKGE